MPGSSQADEVRCSFCGKRQGEVKMLIASPQHRDAPGEDYIGIPPGVPLIYICDGCVESLWEVLHDDPGVQP